MINRIKKFLHKIGYCDWHYIDGMALKINQRRYCKICAKKQRMTCQGPISSLEFYWEDVNNK